MLNTIFGNVWFEDGEYSCGPDLAFSRKLSANSCPQYKKESKEPGLPRYNARRPACMLKERRNQMPPLQRGSEPEGNDPRLGKENALILILLLILPDCKEYDRKNEYARGAYHNDLRQP